MTTEPTIPGPAIPPTQDAPLFPDGATPRRRRGLVVGALVAAVALAGAALGAGMAGAHGSVELRTATAGTHDVAATLDGVATIEPVVSAAVAFPVDGTVAIVDVAVGDEVTVGQQLASLDTEDLIDSLHRAQADLAEAELTLRRALDGEEVSTSEGGGVAPAATGSQEAADAEVVWAVSTDAAGGSSELSRLQTAVLEAQQAVDNALAASEAALSSADEVCTGTVAEGDTATDAGADSATTTTAQTDDTDACRAALDAVLVAQRATAAAQADLAVAAGSLDDHLLSQDTSGATASGGGVAGGTGTTSGTGSTGATDTSPASSEELIALQRSVDASSLGVAVAEQAVAQAVIVAPIEGTVVQVELAAGDEVTSASATQIITIQGDGGMEAVTTVALSDVDGVAVGQSATVVPDGAATAIEGEVVAVGAVPDADASTTSYRVTIGLDAGDVELGNGTTGSVSIVTEDVHEALAVPTSAVTWSDGRSSVQLSVDGEVTEVPVEIGVVGPEWTEILSGVDAGAVVVLADPSAALPGSATESSGAAGAAGGSGGPPSAGPDGGAAGGAGFGDAVPSGPPGS